MSAVTLRDFFNMQSKTGLTPDRKAQIFANIHGQIKPATRQTTSFSMMRSSWYFKTATTAALAFTLIYVLYTPITGPLFQMKDNLLIARQGNVAQAGYVGSILATQGDITIVRNGVSTKTNQLKGGDVVYLYNTSKADFTLRDGSHGVVEGPAQLTIVEHADSGLVLSVNHARYMQIDKVQDDATTITTKEQLTIQTPTSRITTAQDDKVHLALVTTQERQFIQNKGDVVTIESIVPDTASPITQQLANSHVADVTNSVRIYDQVAMIYEELKTQSSSQTYDFTSADFATDDVKVLLALNPENTSDIPSAQIAYVPTERNINTITSTDTTTDEAPRATESDHHTEMLLTMSVNNNDAADVNQPSHTDTELVGSLLTPEDQPNTDAVALTASKSAPELNITQHTIKSPLSNEQIYSIMKYEGENCISTSELQYLQKLFGLTLDLTISDTVIAIQSDLYLTDYLASILNNLSICDTDSNDNQN